VTVSLDGTTQSTNVAADGSFNLGSVPSGIYTLVVKSGGQAGDVVVVVSGGSVTDVGDIDLVGAGQVAGLVTDSATGQPIAGAVVTVTDTSDSTTNQSPQPVRGTQTNNDGSYTVDALPAGAYLVTVSKAGYTSGTLDVTIAAGSTAEGDIKLVAVSAAAKGSVQGTVTTTNSDGSVTPLGGVFIALYPASGAAPTPMPLPPTALGAGNQPVTIYSPGPSWLGYYAYTASDGTYTIAGVPAGAYTANAVRPGFQSATQSVTVVASQATIANFTLTLQQIPTGTVAGTVTDAATSQPISGATVTAIVFGPIPAGGATGGAGGSNGASIQPPTATVLPIDPRRFLLSTTTDANGNYSLVVPTATYAIAASASGYESTEQTINVSQGATDTVNLTLTAISTIKVTLSGTVTKETGAGTNVFDPVAGATVSISTSPFVIPDNSTPITVANYTATTDANGNYSIGIPTGVYDIYASSGGEYSVSSYVRLFADTTDNLVLVTSSVSLPPPLGSTQTSALIQ